MTRRLFALLLPAILGAVACCSWSQTGGGRSSTPLAPRSLSGSEDASRARWDELGEFVDTTLAGSELWGVSVRSVSKGREILGRREHTPLVPASNQKLLTTAVALILLGPDFVYETSLYGPAPGGGGVVAGDVFLRGTGDPTISPRFHGRSTAVFEELADQLKQQGVREIRGDVVGDDNFFDDADFGEGWSRDDELYCYSARISALSFNDNCFAVTVAPGGEVGQPARVELTPDTAYVKIENRVLTSAPGGGTDLRAMRAYGSTSLSLFGRLEHGAPPRHFRFAATNPTLYAVTVLREVLEEKGIPVWGRAVDIDETDKIPNYGSSRPLASHRSAPLKTIIEHTNKESQNLYAELLFRTVGAVSAGAGSAARAADAMRRSLEKMGISSDSLDIHDGSGLSPLNRVAPSQVVQVLDFMGRHPYFPYFFHSLPLAGVDGTLAKRMKNRGAEGRVRAKTGTLAHAVALSGYLNGGGELIAFSIMSNDRHSSDSETRLLQDAICEKLVTLTEESE